MLHPAMGKVNQVRRDAVRPHFARSRRFQLAGGLLLAVVIPWLVRAAFGIVPSDADLVVNSLTANGIAVLLGFYVYQSMITYPGIQIGYFILPTFSVSFAIVILALLFSRLEYNRILLFAGFSGTIIWYYAIALLPERRRRLCVGVIPFGEYRLLRDIPKVSWKSMSEPSLEQAMACDALVADFHAPMPEGWERFLADATLAGLPVLHIKQLQESLTGRVRIDHLSENNFGSLIPAHAYLKIKQVGDFVSALIAGTLLLPFLLLAGLAVRLDSAGPALFRQTRVGYGGRKFTVYKFRTMRHESPIHYDRQDAMTSPEDPRITRLGRLLRRTRIDELPQIINVLRGEMSWIGPRPEALVLSQWYEQELPFYRYRHVVRPGITGWAQVNQGHVAEVDEVFGKLQYDFYYIRYFSPWLDFLVIFRTALIVITGFGSR